ncbi:MAG TPA: Rieske 2Fe-2S domain-containing protein, partial [Gemmataceae bacterium]|nr:Rieske 2Fe-2S domain-containing protein [Gemmataceae bacterium]
TTICPHLGCSVDWRPQEEGKQGQFVCPCHGGTFDPRGELVKLSDRENPAPRGMDRLEVQVVKDDGMPDDAFINVKYENFYQGRPEKMVRL